MDMKRWPASGMALLVIVGCTSMSPYSVDTLVAGHTEAWLRAEVRDGPEALKHSSAWCGPDHGDPENCVASVTRHFHALQQAIQVKHRQNLSAAPACLVSYHDPDVPEDDKLEAAATGRLGLGDARCQSAICEWRHRMYPDVTCDRRSGRNS
jgi:hypothetical protein